MSMIAPLYLNIAIRKLQNDLAQDIWFVENFIFLYSLIDYSIKFLNLTFKLFQVAI